MAEVWIINGIPGSGKSTIARTLAQRFPRSVWLEGDRIQGLIVSGAVNPGEQPVEEENRQIHLNVRNQCLLANSFVDAGFTVFIDYVVVNKSRLEEYRSQLSAASIHFVTLAPGIATALARDHDRPEKTVAKQWAHLEDRMREELQEIGLWVDNSRQTPKETVDEILRCSSQSNLS